MVHGFKSRRGHKDLMAEKLKEFFKGFSILTGTIIGVGFFSLPYVTSIVSFPVILFYFVILGTIVLIIHLFFGELSLRTPDYKRLPGFAKIYLGRFGEKITLFNSIFGLMGASLSYLIVGGEFLGNLLFPISKNLELGPFIYFFLGSILIYFGVSKISWMEFLGIILIFSIPVLIFLKGIPYLRFENLFLKADFSQIFLPYGIVLFSLWGTSLIPELEEILKENKKLLKPVIFSSILASGIFYLFFIILILGIAGKEVSKTAILGLEKFLGKNINYLMLSFAIITTFTSYISLGLTLKNIFWYDLKIRKNLSFFIASFFPFLLYLCGFKEFLKVISLTGGIFLAVEGILILLMYQKINKKLRPLIFFIGCFLLFGIFYEIFYFQK